MSAAGQSTPSSTTFSFSSLEMCSDSSYSLSKYGPENTLEPCILYDIRGGFYSDSDFATEVMDEEINEGINHTIVDRTSEITLVQVTPSNCHNHRDGAATAVRLLNGNNNGMGIPIGYFEDHYVKFRLISIVGGNSRNIGDDAYLEKHEFLLDSALNEIGNAHFILGTCSFASVADRPVALKHKKIVISQVGPPGFYRDVKSNPYVFGIHVNSDTYPLPALQALQFYLKAAGKATSSQPVRVIYRDKSEFFKSTCQSVIDEARIQGFNVTAIEYDPNGDEDGRGVPNSQNVPFLENLTDNLCGSTIENSSNRIDSRLPPAIFACVISEADIILNRIRSNGCRPSLAWFTTATWQWATDNTDVVPYFQGGGQWHQNFKYSDDFFETGQDILNYGFDEFGYNGSYDHVVSYSIPKLIADLIQSFFRIADSPNVSDAFSNRYEDVRRKLLYINTQSVFGPISFNQFQRNIGRGAAGVQWIPASYADTLLDGDNKLAEKATAEFVLGCMSPFDQADAAIIIPSPSGSQCIPGNYVNQTLIESEPSLLGNKCSACPVDSYTSIENESLRCIACPIGSSTMGKRGATACLEDNPNLIPTGLKAMGYVFVICSWSLAIGYIVWMIKHKDDSVVKIGQPEFLFFICIGAIISTSAIIPLTLAEADVNDDTAKASRRCQAFPFLYSLGWVLMYSSLTAKSYRLTKLSGAATRMQRMKITAKQMYKIIIAFLVVDATILIAWQFIDPLVYVRTILSKGVDEGTGMVMIDTLGKCTSNSPWVFLGPIIAVHVCLMVITNVLLWRVRNMSDRYQEQKFVALASIYICELLLLGVPILVAVRDSAAAQYIVKAGVIFLTDTGVLSLIFVPKIRYQNVGLPEGMSVVQSINVRRNTIRNRYSTSPSNERSQGNRDKQDGSKEISRLSASMDFFDSVNESEDSATKKTSSLKLIEIRDETDKGTKINDISDKCEQAVCINSVEVEEKNEESASNRNDLDEINVGSFLDAI